jgi:hypothetical protein
MELLKLIKAENVTEYINLKNILENEPYFLKIKEDKTYPNLFLICGQDNSDYSLKIVNECNGIILDKNTLSIVCYTFDKCPEQNVLNPLLNIEPCNLFFEPVYEGTLIRAYFHENKWMISTKKCIDPSKSNWVSNRSFMELFNDAISIQNPNILAHLNSEYCYSFILMHPENNIIMKVHYPQLFHISTRDMRTFTEINTDIPLIPHLERNPFSISFDELNNYIENDNTLDIEGYMLIDINYNRQKFKKKFFNYVRDLWGNTNNRFFRYIELRQNVEKLNEYLSYFSGDRNVFNQFEINISQMAQNILHYYSEKHVNKKAIKLPYYYAKFIYKLHGDFINTKIFTEYNKVMYELWILEPKKVCFMYNSWIKSAYNETHIETIADNNTSIEVNMEN